MICLFVCLVIPWLRATRLKNLAGTHWNIMSRDIRQYLYHRESKVETEEQAWLEYHADVCSQSS